LKLETNELILWNNKEIDKKKISEEERRKVEE